MDYCTEKEKAKGAMKKLLIIILFLSLCSLALADDFTSDLLPESGFTNLDIGTEEFPWRNAVGDGTLSWDTITDGIFEITAGIGTGLVSLTDGTASWSSNSLSGFTSISGATLTDTVLSINSGSITNAINGTFSGTVQAEQLTSTDDATIADDLSVGGTGIFGQIIDSGLTASLGVYTDASKQLTSTPPTSGVLGYWNRAGTVISTATAGDDVTITGAVGTGVLTVTAANPTDDDFITLLNDNGGNSNAVMFRADDFGNFSFFVDGGDIFLRPKSTGKVQFQINGVGGSVIINDDGTNLANFLWDKHGGGNIGADGANSPDNIFAKTNITAGNNFLASFGAEGSPSHSFKADITSGMYRESTPVASLNFTLGNSRILSLVSTGLIITDDFDVILGGTGFVQSGSEGLKITNLVTITSGSYVDGAEAIVFDNGANGLVSLSGIGTLSAAGTKFLIDGEGFVTQNSGVATDITYTNVGTGIPIWTRFINNQASPILRSQKGRGTTGSPLRLINDDNILQIQAQASNAGFAGVQGRIAIRADGAHGLNDLPTKIVWATTPSTETSAVDNMTLDKDGGLTLSNSNGILTTSSGRIVNTTRLTSGTTLNTTHHHVAGDTDGGPFTITLPAGVAGTEYRIANTGTSSNNLTITPDGAELLIGVNSNFVLADGEALHIVYETTEGWF